jgi:hypothetical protein
MQNKQDITVSQNSQKDVIFITAGRQFAKKTGYGQATTFIMNSE